MEMKSSQINGRNRNFDVAVQLDENDLQEAYEIALTMDTEGWKRLQKHVEVIKEQVIENGKATIKHKDRTDLSQICWSILEGFDVCSGMAQNIVDMAAIFRKRQ